MAQSVGVMTVVVVAAAVDDVAADVELLEEFQAARDWLAINIRLTIRADNRISRLPTPGTPLS